MNDEVSKNENRKLFKKGGKAERISWAPECKSFLNVPLWDSLFAHGNHSPLTAAFPNPSTVWPFSHLPIEEMKP